MKKAPWQRIATLITDLLMDRHRAGEPRLSAQKLFKMIDQDDYTSYEEYKDARKEDMEGYANWFRTQRGWSK